MLVFFIQSILLTVVSCYTLPFQSRGGSLLFSSRKNIGYSFNSLESDPHIVFLEHVLYTRVKEYRDKYTFSYTHSYSEIFENMNKYILYPINEDDFYKEVEDDYYKEMEAEEEEEEIVIDEEDGFHEFSMEKHI